MKEYLSRHRLKDLIDDNDLIILVISRFSIPFGFGNASVAEVCRENGVDIPTFLAVANLIAGKESSQHAIKLESLTGYLRKAHKYFLDFNLPTIRRKLIEAINCTDVNDVAFLILKYFDDYAIEVRKHMEYENDVVFSYISRLSEGKDDGKFRIADYSSGHTDMGDKLNELKDIVIHHFHQTDNDMLNSVLYDIIGCQNDLDSHCRIENELLVPAVAQLEQRCEQQQSATEEEEKDGETGTSESIDSISEREKDVIRCVAKGMSNKEIAEALFLSIHTITTYRRNIASKLQIHSPAGLTIFAIINKLIEIREVKLQ